MAALTSSRHNPTLHTFYQRLLGYGKLPKVALTACIRKLLVILNAMLKLSTPWITSTSTVPEQDEINTTLVLVCW